MGAPRSGSSHLLKAPPPNTIPSEGVISADDFGGTQAPHALQEGSKRGQIYESWLACWNSGCTFWDHQHMDVKAGDKWANLGVRGPRGWPWGAAPSVEGTVKEGPERSPRGGWGAGTE